MQAFVYRCPIETPVVTSFGAMRDRPMVLVRVEDGQGCAGWGEVWCNFPAVGAEHRARLVASVLEPLLVGREFEHPAQAFELLSESTAVLAIQSGEPGPVAQAIAGIDTALWDLVARRAGQPLWRLLGAASGRVPVYASGLNPETPQALARRMQAAGHTAFKLKIGFGPARDLDNLAALRDALGAAQLMVDANQAFSLAEALEILPGLEPLALQWVEEPLRADRPWKEWAALRRAASIPLACGENLYGPAAFHAAIASRAIGVLQPDLAKWGGISGCLPVAQEIRAAGLRYCPHFLGGGVGLLASAHLLAAVGGDGMLEIDANVNPLRSRLCGGLRDVVDGHCSLDEAPGLGIDPATCGIESFIVPLPIP